MHFNGLRVSVHGTGYATMIRAFLCEYLLYPGNTTGADVIKYDYSLIKRSFGLHM